MTARFRVYRDKVGKWRWALVAANGRIAEMVAEVKRRFVPELIWRLTATAEQRARVAKNGGYMAVRKQVFAELDEALAVSK